MAACVYCERETLLYDSGTPVCIGCSDRLEAGERLKRKSLAQADEPKPKTMNAKNGN